MAVAASGGATSVMCCKHESSSNSSVLQQCAVAGKIGGVNRTQCGGQRVQCLRLNACHAWAARIAAGAMLKVDPIGVSAGVGQCTAEEEEQFKSHGC